MCESDESPPTRYALDQSQEFVRDLLLRATRTAIARPDQTPLSLVQGALFLHAVERLPYVGSRDPVSLSWKADYGDSWGLCLVTIGWDALLLETLEGFKADRGWDHESRTEWRVDESRQSGLEGGALEEALEQFLTSVSDSGCEVEFRSDADPPFDDLEADSCPVDWDEAFDEEDE